MESVMEIRFPKFDPKLAGKLKVFKYHFPAFTFNKPEEGAEVPASANAGIQFLARTISLVIHLTGFNRIPPSFGCFKDGIYSRLSLVFNRMARHEERNLEDFISWLRTKLNLQNMFIPKTQNDAGELLQKILELVCEEAQEAITIAKNRNLPVLIQSNRHIQMELQKSILFTKKIKNHLKCSCGKEKIDSDVEKDQFIQTLYIPEKAETLQDCFDNLSSNKRKTQCPAQKCLKIAEQLETLEFMEEDNNQMPEHLYIQLNIFRAKSDEINSPLVKVKNKLFPGTDFLTVFVGASQKIKYEVETLVCHEGENVQSGHYVTFDKKAPNQWIMYDDTTVSNIDNAVFFNRIKTKFMPYLIRLKRVQNSCTYIEKWNKNKFCLTGKNAELNAILTATVDLQIADLWNDESLKTLIRTYRGNFAPPNTDLITGLYNLKSIKGCHAVFKELIKRNNNASNYLLELEIKAENNEISLNKILAKEMKQPVQKDIIMFFDDHKKFKNNLKLSSHVTWNKDGSQYSWKVSSVIIQPPKNAFYVYQTFESKGYKFEYSSNHFEEFAKLEKMPDHSTSCFVMVLKYQGVSIIEPNTEIHNAHHDPVPDVHDDVPLTSDHESINDTMDDEGRVPIVTSPIVVQDHNESNHSDGVVPQSETQIYSNFEEFVLQEIKQHSGNVEMNCCEKKTLLYDETAFKMLGIIRPLPSKYKKDRDINVVTTALVYNFPTVLKHYLKDHQLVKDSVEDMWIYCNSTWKKMKEHVQVTENEETGKVSCFECEICRLKIYYKNYKNHKVFTPMFHYILFHGNNREFVKDQQLFSTFQSYWEEVISIDPNVSTVCPLCKKVVPASHGELHGQQITMLDTANHTVDFLNHFLKKHHRKPSLIIYCTILENWEYRNWVLYNKKTKKTETTKMARQSLAPAGDDKVTCHICGMIIQKSKNSARKSIGNEDPTIVEHNLRYHIDRLAECPFCKEKLTQNLAKPGRHEDECKEFQEAVKNFPEKKTNGKKKPQAKATLKVGSIKKTPIAKHQTPKATPALTRLRAKAQTNLKDPIPENNTKKGPAATTASPIKPQPKGNKKKVVTAGKPKIKPKSPTNFQQAQNANKPVVEKPQADMETPVTSKPKTNRKRQRGKKYPKKNSQDQSGSGNSDHLNDSQTPDKPKQKKRPQ